MKNRDLAALVAETRVLTPTTPCLWCRKAISSDVIRAENLPPDQRQKLVGEGYLVGGVGQPAPSVIASPSSDPASQRAHSSRSSPAKATFAPPDTSSTDSWATGSRHNQQSPIRTVDAERASEWATAIRRRSSETRTAAGSPEPTFCPGVCVLDLFSRSDTSPTTRVLHRLYRVGAGRSRSQPVRRPGIACSSR
jgi:hypothetical protein